MVLLPLSSSHGATSVIQIYFSISTGLESAAMWQLQDDFFLANYDFRIE